MAWEDRDGPVPPDGGGAATVVDDDRYIVVNNRYGRGVYNLGPRSMYVITALCIGIYSMSFTYR